MRSLGVNRGGAGSIVVALDLFAITSVTPFAFDFAIRGIDRFFGDVRTVIGDVDPLP